MQPRRKVAPTEQELNIIGHSAHPKESDVPEHILNQLKAASKPPNGAVRFSKHQLENMGLSTEGGGLVSINGNVYTFVSKSNDPNKTHILGEGGFGRVKLLQNIENPSDQKALKVLGAKGMAQIEIDYEEDREYQNFKRELEIAEALGRGSSQVIRKEGEDKHVSFCGVLDLAPGFALYNFIDLSIGDSPILDAKKRLDIILQCFKEVKLLHSKGFIHHDIKTLNFMYDYQNHTIRIIDFGFTRKYDSNNLGVLSIDVSSLGRLIQDIFGIDYNNIEGSNVAKKVFSSLSAEEQQDLLNLAENMHKATAKDFHLDEAIEIITNILIRHENRHISSTAVIMSESKVAQNVSENPISEDNNIIMTMHLPSGTQSYDKKEEFTQNNSQLNNPLSDEKSPPPLPSSESPPSSSSEPPPTPSSEHSQLPSRLKQQ